MKLPGAERVRGLAALGLRIWLIIGILLRVTRLRDRFHPFSFIYYTTPWPVIAFGLAILALHHGRLRNWHRMRRYLVLMAGALMTWVALSWRSTPPSEEAGKLRVVLWNVAHAETRFPKVAAWLHQEDPDIMAIAEAESANPQSGARWRAEFSGYTARFSPGGMLCLVRGEILETQTGELAPGSFYALHKVRVRGRNMTVLQVDIYARPRSSRREPLSRLAELVKEHARENLVVLGDFNTPADSAHLDGLRAELSECFEAAGNGIAETWPFPVPVLSLDQVWVSRSLHPVRCTHPWLALSDHRPVVADVAGR